MVNIILEMSLTDYNDLLTAEEKSMIGGIAGNSIPWVFIPQLIAYY